MAKSFKTRWIEALRSGEYKQGTAFLKRQTSNGFTFCCLGVACDLVNPKGWEENKYGGQPNWQGTKGGSDFSISTGAKLPFITTRAACILILMNDRGQSFIKIANYIRRHLFTNDNGLLVILP